MKKAFVLCLAVLLIFSVSSCVKTPVKCNLLYDIDMVESISIYHIEQKIELIRSIDENNDPIIVLDKTQSEAFMADFDKLLFTESTPAFPIAFTPNFSYLDYVIKISYQNGAYDFVSYDGIQGGIDVDGNETCSHYYCDNSEWENLINKYLAK